MPLQESIFSTSLISTSRVLYLLLFLYISQLSFKFSISLNVSIIAAIVFGNEFLITLAYHFCNNSAIFSICLSLLLYIRCFINSYASSKNKSGLKIEKHLEMMDDKQAQIWEVISSL